MNRFFSRCLKIYLNKKNKNKTLLYDRTLLWLTFSLISVGFIMVTSASIPIGEDLNNDPFYFAKREAFYICVAFFFSSIILRIPMKCWQHYSSIMLLSSIIMLVIVLIIGNTVNGSSRWITVGPLRIQPAEFSKLSLFCYLADYLVRKRKEVKNKFWGFCKPMGIMGIIDVLLLAQPDLGTVILLFITTLTMLFLAEAKLWPFLLVIILGILFIISLIVTNPYRMNRITSFWNPWKDPFGKSYQLTQSLMAFGRGEYLGEGLGNSIQKLEYLPEAHTDFIFSILGEELGYIGAIMTLLMIFSIAFRAMSIGYRAFKTNLFFSGFFSCSIGIWFNIQTLINVGGASGVLPTKGITLPFISYGGSSFLIMSISIVFLLRMDYEMRLMKIQAIIRDTK